MGWPSWPFSFFFDSSKSDTEFGKGDEVRTQTLKDTPDRCNEDGSFRPSVALPNNLTSYLSPQFWLPVALFSGAIVATRIVYKAYLRRLPGATSVPATYFTNQRTLFGIVTSVGDGDGFRLFHTPGGMLAGWGWLPWRRIPTGRALKDQTISIRLAGIDAPEVAHFGKPGQPGGQEALVWLKAFLLGKRVRCYVYKKDQYDRLVGTVKIRRFGGLWRQDIGLTMLKQGLATVYEAKTGAVFGGAKIEEKYRRAEWWAQTRRKGIWKRTDGNWESPRQFKTRMGSGTEIKSQD